MKVLSKLEDPGLGRKMLGRVRELAARAAQHLGRPVVLMEVCGTHTMTVSRMGLRGLLAGLLELRSGPGCPVCVTSAPDIERVIALARLPGLTVSTFGDMVRVPGVRTSLERERARGARVQIVYSPADAVALARENPGREVVFLGVGFETTAPLVALAIKQAAGLNLDNFSVYSVHKLIPPVMRALLAPGDVRVDGFLLPGHVCAVTGRRAFDFIARDFNLPAVVTGFTPVDILDALHVLLERVLAGEARVINGYRWLVREDGNSRARREMEDCFYPGDARWRGFGTIPASGLLVRDELARYDAARKFAVEAPEVAGPGGCRCGEVLRGLITPAECGLFGHKCTPAGPAGPCMVSSEGACAAYFRYRS